MHILEIKFETEADKESFASSIVQSFNRSGKDKSVHANTVERVGDTIFFTRQPVVQPEVESDSGREYSYSPSDDTNLGNSVDSDPVADSDSSSVDTSGGDFAGGGAGGEY